MSLQERMTEDRRGVVLKALAEDSAYRLSENTIKTVLGYFGHNVASDGVRQLMLWLEQHSLVTIERLASDGREMWISKLTRLGLDVARGCAHVGITRPEPG